MINIICIKTQYGENRDIRNLQITLKYVPHNDEQELYGHTLVATASAAFYNTTLLSDEGESLETIVDAERNTILKLKINFRINSTITLRDVANFIEAFQKSLDETSLF